MSKLPEVAQAQITVSDLVPEDQDAKLAMLDDLNGLLAPVLDPHLAASKPPPTTAEIIDAAKAVSRSALIWSQRAPAARCAMRQRSWQAIRN